MVTPMMSAQQCYWAVLAQWSRDQDVVRTLIVRAQGSPTRLGAHGHTLQMGEGAEQ